MTTLATHLPEDESAAPTLGAGQIFIVGMPRSGTTLISKMLSRHSSIHISPETHYLAHDWRINKGLDLSVRTNRTNFIREFVTGPWFEELAIERSELEQKFLDDSSCTFRRIFEFILREQAKKHGKQIYGEKTPGHYEHVDTLLDWFPNARVIFMMRDPRAVAASTIDTPFGSRFVNFHARRWNRANEVWNSFRNERRVMLLKYEDLVGDAERELSKVCKFIGVISEQAMLDSSITGADSSDGSWRQDHYRRAVQPIDSHSVSKWKKRLRPGQVRTIEYLCVDGMTQHEYERPTNKFSVIDPPRVFTAVLFSRIIMGANRHLQNWFGRARPNAISGR